MKLLIHPENPREQAGSVCRRTPRTLRQLVARAAARQLPALPPRERADLLEGIALLLTDTRQKELARYTVGLLRQTEEHQLKVLQQLNVTPL